LKGNVSVSWQRNSVPRTQEQNSLFPVLPLTFRKIVCLLMPNFSFKKRLFFWSMLALCQVQSSY